MGSPNVHDHTNLPTLVAGADPNTTLRGGETALMTAARTGKIRPAKAFLSHDASVENNEENGQTTLMWAAADTQVEVVKLLLKASADFRTPLRSGSTPLFFGVREGQSNVVQILL